MFRPHICSLTLRIKLCFVLACFHSLNKTSPHSPTEEAELISMLYFGTPPRCIALLQTGFGMMQNWWFPGNKGPCCVFVCWTVCSDRKNGTSEVCSCRLGLLMAGEEVSVSECVCVCVFVYVFVSRSGSQVLCHCYRCDTRVSNAWMRPHASNKEIDSSTSPISLLLKHLSIFHLVALQQQ